MKKGQPVAEFDDGSRRFPPRHRHNRAGKCTLTCAHFFDYNPSDGSPGGARLGRDIASTRDFREIYSFLNLSPFPGVSWKMSLLLFHSERERDFRV